MNKPGIRPAVKADASTLSALALRSKSMWGYDEMFLEQCRDGLTIRQQDIENRAYRFGVYECKDRVAGFYAMRHTGPNSCEVEALFVEPELARQGVGSRLLRHAMTIAARSGAHTLVVESDPHAEGFYLAAGAVADGLVESGSIAGRYLQVFRFDLFRIQGAWSDNESLDQSWPRQA